MALLTLNIKIYSINLFDSIEKLPGTSRKVDVVGIITESPDKVLFGSANF